ncbi:2-oxoglutarate oxidoreductase [bacterium]|nr:2-oxoglutarate oxidoreductase [bacterium]
MENLTTIYKTPNSIKKDATFTFCPGCDHGVAIRLVAQVIDELDLQKEAIAVASSGCSVFLYNFLDVDCVESPHGRACAVATGIRRAQSAKGSDNLVFTYQGDGDFGSIGISESLHSALRGENITAICINNTNYGMTGGQMGPTSVMGQVTTTSPTGRNKEYHGYPIKCAEHIALCEGTCYSARVALYDIKNIYLAKNAIKKAFQYQKEKLGFSFVEILSSCPTNWKLSPQDAHKRIENELSKVYPLGTIKDIKENINV